MERALLPAAFDLDLLVSSGKGTSSLVPPSEEVRNRASAPAASRLLSANAMETCVPILRIGCGIREPRTHALTFVDAGGSVSPGGWAGMGLCVAASVERAPPPANPWTF